MAEVYLNHYQCPVCGASWDSAQDTAGRDTCPDCGRGGLLPSQTETVPALDPVHEPEPDGEDGFAG